MLVPFEEYIIKANRSQTIDELVQVFIHTVKQHGLDKMIFCLLSDHQKIGLSAGVGHIQNYPEDWMQYYFEQGFDRLDPVISYCYQKFSTFTWNEMEENLQLTPKQKKCLNLGIEAGLNNGVCTPLWGPQRFAGIGLASTEKKDSFDGNIDLITAYCNHFYIAFQRLSEKQNNKPEDIPNIYLTPKEQEVLLWAAKGKSNNDISDILDISVHGVDYHMRQIYTKLDANSRILAVTKAITYGLIQP